MDHIMRFIFAGIGTGLVGGSLGWQWYGSAGLALIVAAFLLAIQDAGEQPRLGECDVCRAPAVRIVAGEAGEFYFCEAHARRRPQ